MSSNCWIVVADEAIARIVAHAKGKTALENVEELTHPAAHARENELRGDQLGRRAGNDSHAGRTDSNARLRNGASATASAGESERHQEAHDFAREVADRLADAAQQGRYDELTLVAAPRFLGLLRKALPDGVSRRVRASFDKDLVHLTNDEIARHVLEAGA